MDSGLWQWWKERNIEKGCEGVGEGVQWPTAHYAAPFQPHTCYDRQLPPSPACMTLETCCTLGWSHFEKNATQSMLCQIVFGPQFQNFMSQCCLFPWSQGLSKFGLLTCKICKKNFFLKRFSSLRQEGTDSLNFLRAKNKEKIKKYLFWPCTDQKQYCPFSEIKK